MGCGAADEVVSGSRIQQRSQLVRTHMYAELHRLVRSNAGDRGQGDQGLVGVIGRVLSRLRTAAVRIFRLLHNIIGDLQEEQPSTLVATDVRLITVVAKALLSALGHLIWGEPLEEARRC